MKLNKQLIEKVAKGDVAIDNTGNPNLELLRAVLKEAFPQDKDISHGKAHFFQTVEGKYWSGHYKTSLPTIPLLDFLEKEEAFPLDDFGVLKEEQWIPQVGDYVITKGYSNSYDGRILKITKIDSNRYYYFEVFDKGYYYKTHNFSKKSISRKALPHEIPTQELSKEDLLAEAKRRFPIGCKFKCLDLFKQNTQGGKIHSIDFDSFKYYGETCHYKKAITDGDNGFIYIDGTWAEIVEEPKVTEKSLTESLVHSMQDDFKALQVKSMYFEKAIDWSQVLRATGEFSFGTPSQKPVKNSKILPIKVRNSNITESTELPKRTRIKIIKKQLLTI